MKESSDEKRIATEKDSGRRDYHQEYNVTFGKFPVPSKNRSYYVGKGEVIFDSKEMIIHAVYSPPALVITIIIWLVTIFLLFASFSIYLGEPVCALGIPNPVFLLIVYVIVKYLRKKSVATMLDPQKCSAHFIVKRDVVIIRTENDVWIDIQPEKEKEKEFIDAVRSCFAQRFFEIEALSSIDQMTGAVLLLESPKEHKDVVSIISDIAAREFSLPREQIGTDYALKDNLASDNSETSKLRSALEEEFGLVIAPEDAVNIRTVGQIADYIERTMRGEVSE
jgi:acyl carrier protein